MPMTEHEEFVYQRIRDFTLLSDYTMLMRAAKILESEPALAQGSYLTGATEMIDVARAAGVTLSPTETKPCHCLVGAIIDAAGGYDSTGHRINEMVPLWRWRWCASDLPQLIHSQLDQAKLAAVITAEDSDPGDLTDEIYLYSDKVLFNLGGAGPLEAARILEVAASHC